MRTYHPKSWSQQARIMADNQFEDWRDAIDGTTERLYPDPENEKWINDDKSEKNHVTYFHHSFRHPLIRRRAAKRFGRLVRKYRKQKGLPKDAFK